MQEQLTIMISAEHKRFIKRHARKHNKSISKFIDDLLSSIQRESYKVSDNNDLWLEETAGSYSSGKKDVLAELFKDIKR